MGGQWETYRCDRCPLTLELGGWTAWDESGVVCVDAVQVACTACGTMHRIVEEHGVCYVTALLGPVRYARTVKLRDCCGEEFETEEWTAEPDWQRVSLWPRGISPINSLPCTHCGQVGRMVNLEQFIYPGGYSPDAIKDPKCPLCQGPVECIAISDAI